MAILRRFTPLVEPISIDEAFLDVTASRALFGDGATIARRIKDAIRDEVRLTASVGVAATKLVAKIGSDLTKPDRLVVLPPAPPPPRRSRAAAAAPLGGRSRPPPTGRGKGRARAGQGPRLRLQHGHPP